MARDNDVNLIRIVKNFKENTAKLGIQAYIILLSQLRKEFFNSFLTLFSQWRIITIISIVIYILFAESYFPQLLLTDNTAIPHRNLLQIVTKCTLIYGLCWVIVMAIHSRYYNDYERVLSISNKESFKRIILFCISIGGIYLFILGMPINHYANRFLGAIITYALLSQEYVRKCFTLNLTAILTKKVTFVNTFSLNQLITVSIITTSLISIIFPEWEKYIRYMQLIPLLIRIWFSIIIGTGQEYCNCIKFILMGLVNYLTIVNLTMYLFYLRFVTSIYSYYWDIFRDWKLNIRFRQNKNYRIDIPAWYFGIGIIGTFMGRFIWIFLQMDLEQKLILQLTRRSLWNIFRIQRQLVYRFQKGEGNSVKDLFS